MCSYEVLTKAIRAVMVFSEEQKWNTYNAVQAMLTLLKKRPTEEVAEFVAKVNGGQLPSGVSSWFPAMFAVPSCSRRRHHNTARQCECTHTTDCIWYYLIPVHVIVCRYVAIPDGTTRGRSST